MVIVEHRFIQRSEDALEIVLLAHGVRFPLGCSLGGSAPIGFGGRGLFLSRALVAAPALDASPDGRGSAFRVRPLLLGGTNLRRSEPGAITRSGRRSAECT